ncbi:unnamed protein product [Phytomonas sp. Hart1]|nr:unnamed protein product [Phytomonas sp. Hart1]|eukprot:CCW66635.1 unnamed protein product [Phytomonas sp. isolate Hart1]
MERPENCTDNPAQLAELLKRASVVIKKERSKSAALSARNDQLSVVLGDLLRESLGSHDPSAAMHQYLSDNNAQIKQLLGSRTSLLNWIDGHLMLEKNSKQPTKNATSSNSLVIENNLHKEAFSSITGDIATTTAARLRRAFAPAPNKQQLAEVVDVMVRALQTDLKQRISRREWQAPLEINARTCIFHFNRLKACTYLFEWVCSDNTDKLLTPCVNTDEYTSENDWNSAHAYPSNRYTTNHQRHEKRKRQKVLNFTIDSGQLCILSGGGHINALEFFERTLHIQC